MVDCVIIDDEQNAIDNLIFSLTKFKEIIIVNTFTNPLEAIPFLEKNKVDLIFLDIEMPQMDGFQFLNKLHIKNIQVVITSAYNSYALKAFKHNTIDYLLKPIDRDELKETIKKVVTRIDKERYNLEEVLITIQRMMNPKKIAIKNNGQLFFFENDEISHIISDGNYCKIHLSNKDTLFVTKKIKEMDFLLPKPYFLRVHNSYIVNIQKIKTLIISENYIVLKNNIKIPFSKTYKNNLLDKL